MEITAPLLQGHTQVTNGNGKAFQPLSWSPILDPSTPGQEHFLMGFLSPVLHKQLPWEDENKEGRKEGVGSGRDRSNRNKEDESEQMLQGLLPGPQSQAPLSSESGLGRAGTCLSQDEAWVVLGIPSLEF